MLAATRSAQSFELTAHELDATVRSLNVPRQFGSAVAGPVVRMLQAGQINLAATIAASRTLRPNAIALAAPSTAVP